jgi:cob(I)alamin adenosyltransferase
MKFSGKGDNGYTGLLGGGERVPKYNLRIEALGDLDEASSALGVARAASQAAPVREAIYAAQQQLYALMAEVAMPGEELDSKYKVTNEQVQGVEALIDRLQEEVKLPNKFIIPGETLASAHLDLARTVVRRAERSVVRLSHEGLLDNEHLLAYLNRLSSLVFVLARYEEAVIEHHGFAIAAAPPAGTRD